MKNKTVEIETMQPIELWVDTDVCKALKRHAERFPYYHASISEIERNEADNQVKISFHIDGKGRNENYQNLCLFLIDALKPKS